MRCYTVRARRGGLECTWDRGLLCGASEPTGSGDIHERISCRVTDGADATFALLDNGGGSSLGTRHALLRGRGVARGPLPRGRLLELQYFLRHGELDNAAPALWNLSKVTIASIKSLQVRSVATWPGLFLFCRCGRDYPAITARPRLLGGGQEPFDAWASFHPLCAVPSSVQPTANVPALRGT